MPDRLYFTGSDEANALIASDPMALLIGFALDQQVTRGKGVLRPARAQRAARHARCRDAGRRRTSSRVSREAGDPPLPRLDGQRVHEPPCTCATVTTAMPRACGTTRRRRRAPRQPGRAARLRRDEGQVAGCRARQALRRRRRRRLVPAHPTLGDVDSPQALADYQAAKRIHKAEWSKLRARR